MHRRSQDAATSYPSPRTRACLSLVFARSVMLLLSAAVLALAGCATVESQRAEQAKPAIATGDDAVTVENLLRWPLEGQPSGTDNTIAALRRVFDIREIRPGILAGDGPVQLADGYTLSFASIAQYRNDVDIDIGLDSAPCFSPERAVHLTGAIVDPVFQDAHGVDRGKRFKSERNGVRVRFTTTPLTYQCITAIYIDLMDEKQR